MSHTLYRFCTYFDQNYLFRGLALYRSLRRHCTNFFLHVLCLDDETRDVLSALELPEVRLITLAELERREPRLLEAKRNRSKVEYYFTCTPALLLHVLDRSTQGPLTYLDADLFFYSVPTPIYEELGDKSILIVPHRFPDHLRSMEVHGIYNVGLLSFAKDQTAFNSLLWWRDRCLEWCFDRAEDGKFGDQKYLDDWPTRFPRVAVLEHRGAGLAPWNVSTYPLGYDKGRVWVDTDPLIFYHFNGLRRLTSWLFDSGLYGGADSMTRVLRKHLYKPYLRELKEVEEWIRTDIPEFKGGWGSARFGSSDYRFTTLAKKLLQGNILIQP